MSGIELRDDELVVERPPNALDELAMEFSSTLTENGVEHVFVAGYVAILSGRARATEDIDVLIERLSADQIDDLVETLRSNGYWDLRCRSTRCTTAWRTGRTSGLLRTTR